MYGRNTFFYCCALCYTIYEFLFGHDTSIGIEQLQYAIVRDILPIGGPAFTYIFSGGDVPDDVGFHLVATYPYNTIGKVAKAILLGIYPQSVGSDIAIGKFNNVLGIHPDNKVLWAAVGVYTGCSFGTCTTIDCFLVFLEAYFSFLEGLLVIGFFCCNCTQFFLLTRKGNK